MPDSGGDNGGGGKHIRDVLFEQVTQLIAEREKGFAERFAFLDTMSRNGLAGLEKASNVGLAALDKRVEDAFAIRDRNLEVAIVAHDHRVSVSFEARDKAVEVALASQDKRVNDAFDARDKAVNAALSAAKEAVNAALSAAKEAVNKAEVASAIRFESVNEFRKTLTDQTNTFIPRLEVDQRMQAMEKTIDGMARLQASSAGRSQGLNAGWGYLAGGIGLIVGLVSIVLALLKAGTP